MDRQDPGIGWFHGRWKKVFAGLDKEKIADSVRRLRGKHPDENERKLVKRLVDRSARLSGAAGMAGSAPALLPGPGLAISVLSMVPEEMYLIRRQCTLLLQIAAVYGFDLKEEERLYEVIALAGNPSRAIEAAMVAKYDVQRVAVRAAASMAHAPWVKRAYKLGALGRGSARAIPVLGFIMGGAINFFSFRALGRKGALFYERLRAGRDDETLLVGRTAAPPTASLVGGLLAEHCSGTTSEVGPDSVGQTEFRAQDLLSGASTGPEPDTC